MNVLVSVVVPVYNAEEYLEQAVDSILNQTLSDIEIIFVDDGSTDRTFEIISDYLERDSRVLLNKQPHSGAAAARNRGLELSTGQYLSFLDADDLFDSAMLESMYKISSLNKLDVLLTPFRFSHDAANAKRGLVTPKGCPVVFNNSFCSEDFFQIASPNAWCKLFRRDFILDNGLRFQSLSTCNDVFFSYASMLLADRISILNECFITYRRNVSGSITSNRGEGYGNILEVGYALKNLLVRSGYYSSLRKSFYKRMYSCFEYEVRFVSEMNLKDFNRSVALFLNEV